MRRMFAGVDVSTYGVAAVALDPESYEMRILETPFSGKNVNERIQRARHVLPRAPDWKEVVLAAFEDPMSHGFGVSKSLGIFTGMIMSHVPLAITILRLPPEEWKQECGLPARAEKPAVKEYVNSLVPSSENWSFDLCDAYCIARAAITICERVIT